MGWVTPPVMEEGGRTWGGECVRGDGARVGAGRGGRVWEEKAVLGDGIDFDICCKKPRIPRALPPMVWAAVHRRI